MHVKGGRGVWNAITLFLYPGRLQILLDTIGSQSRTALDRNRGPFSELLQVRRHRIVVVGLALLALADSPLVLADASPAALLALAPLPLVLADARPAALLALAPSPLVLADARPSALLALAPSLLVLADARPAALLAEMPFAVVRTPRSCSRSTLLERSTLCLSWLFPPAAPLFRFSISCCPITVHVFVPCRPVVARHAIGALERPSGSKLQQSVARCSGREASVHAPLRAAPDLCAASARDVFADPRKEWRRGLADGRHSRASGRRHPHSRNCQWGRKCGEQEVCAMDTHRHSRMEGLG